MINDLLVIHTDGGARGNPGPAASAFVVFDQSKKEIYKSGKYLGHATNNVAEYSAVVLALEWVKSIASENRATRINFLIDSQLVVNQLNGIFKVKDSKLRNFVMEVHSLQNEITSTIAFHAIPREQNKEADLLVNEILDKISK